MKYFAICLFLFVVDCILGSKHPNIIMIVADDLVSVLFHVKLYSPQILLMFALVIEGNISLIDFWS